MIDYLIRGHDEVVESLVLAGSYVRLGNLESYVIFSTFNSLSTHVHSSQGKLIVEIYFYVDGKGVELRYHNGVVSVMYNKHEYLSSTSDKWIELLNRANPYGSTRITGAEYMRLFESMLRYRYDMNDLKNRQFLTYTSILNRVIYSGLTKKKATTNVRKLFDNGNIFNLLSKKSVLSGETSCKNYPQSYSNNMDNGRSNKICEFVSTVKRTLNDAFKNSDALRFPDDGIGIICPISVKDLKDVGEQNVLADYVIVSESVNDYEVYEYLNEVAHSQPKRSSQNFTSQLASIKRKVARRILTSNSATAAAAGTNTTESSDNDKTLLNDCYDDDDDDDDDDDIDKESDVDDDNNNDECFTRPSKRQAIDQTYANNDYGADTSNQLPKSLADGQVTIVLNEFLCGLRLDWSFELLLRLKQRFMHVTTKYFFPYVFIITKACVPIKYHDEYDAYFSPAEITEYGLRFPSASNYSTTWKHLDPWGRHLNPSAKSTVSINNIKGSVANVESDFQLACMKYSLGITCYMRINEATRRRIFESAVSERGCHPYTHHFERLERMGFRMGEVPQIAETNHAKAVASLRKMYDFQQLAYRCSKSRSQTYACYYDVNLREMSKEYVNMVLGMAERPFNVYNLRVWVCFGNYKGNCIEDGVVIDRGFAELVPPIEYNACISVSFISKTNKNNCMFVAINETRQSRDSFVGYVITEEEVSIRHSRHCYVLRGIIGNHFYYLVHFNPKTNLTYSNLSIEHVKHGKTLIVLIKGEHYARLGSGSKVANSFGQKNVNSYLTDLRNELPSGVTRDGRRVHAQMLYSDVSIVGRIQSSQFAAGLRSPDLAIGENFELIFPTDITVHTLHPYTNNHQFVTRSDTLVNSNGFETQSLAQTNFLLRLNKNVMRHALQIIEMHGFEILDASQEYLDFYRSPANNILLDNDKTATTSTSSPPHEPHPMKHTRQDDNELFVSFTPMKLDSYEPDEFDKCDTYTTNNIEES